MTPRRTIPTILGVAMLFVLVLALAATTQVSTKLFSRAVEPTALPQNVVISNISDSGWTVSWTTASKTSGVVYFGQNSNTDGGVALDDRDVSAVSSNHTTHFVTVRQAHPGKYYFKIGTNGSQYSIDVPTALVPGSKVDPLYGQVNLPSGQPAADALVVMTVKGAQTLATYTLPTGNFTLSLLSLRDSSLSQALVLKDGTPETFKIIGEDASVSQVLCVSGQDRPIPTVKLGNNLDCFGVSALKPIPVASGSATATSSALLDSQKALTLKNGQNVDQLPTFSGKVGASQTVKIVIHSTQVVTDTIKANPDGSWSWTPPSNLTPGQHSVTLTITYADGSTQTETRTFTVTGSDILPITSGTPSGEVVPPPLPAPVASPSPIATPPPTVVTPTPTTGSTSYTLVGIAVGLILLTGGLVVTLGQLL